MTEKHNFAELTEEDQERQDRPRLWKSFQDAHLEQPLLSQCCFPFFFRYRWKILRPFQTYYVFSNYSIGFCLFFGLLVIYSLYSVVNTWDSVKSSATVPTYLLQLTFLFSVKNSVWLFLTGISSENFLYWHKLVSILCIITGIFHGISRYGFTGLLLTVLLVLIAGFSTPCFRKRYYHIFFKSHVILSILTIFAAFAHSVSLWAVAFWILDSILRVFIVRKNRNKIRNLETEVMSSNLLKINFEKGSLEFRAGQYFLICCPKISVFEWHPFNVCSAPHEPTATILIKVLGDWTSRLHSLAKEEKNLNVWIEGPYGNSFPSFDADDEYQNFLLIGGGIGVAPFLSISKSLLFEKREGRVLENIMLVWSTRDQNLMNDVIASNTEVKEKEIGTENYNVLLENHFHFTGREEEFECIKKNETVQVYKGRPDLENYFEIAKEKAMKMGKKKLAVACSGPQSLMIQVFELGKQKSTSDFKFHVSLEVSEF